MTDLIFILIVTVLVFMLFTFSIVIGPCLSEIYNDNLTLSVIYVAIYDRETYKWYKIAQKMHGIKQYTKVPPVTPNFLYLAPLDDGTALYYNDRVVISTIYPRLIEEIIANNIELIYFN